MAQDPLVSIVITNYNYERFLREAIDSALRQSHPRTEVVVVDDGSTDRSRELIAGYGGRIVPVLKQNGGLASAINAGVARSRGELVALLDADDIFVPIKVERVVRAYRESPRAVLFYHRLRTVDAAGTPRGMSWHRELWTGDIREKVAHGGGWWPRPTTSAMTFTRAFLEQILPMGECSEPGRAVWPDAYAGDLAPFFGEIRGLPETLAYYRVHGNNSQLRFNAEKQLRQVEFEYEQLKEGLRRFGKGAPLRRMDHSLAYLESAYGVKPGVSFRSVLMGIVACPQLSPSGMLLEIVRLARRAVRQSRPRLGATRDRHDDRGVRASR